MPIKLNTELYSLCPPHLIKSDNMNYLDIQMECVKPERNRKAFYHLVATKDLFSYKLIRRWGRIGTKGQPGHSERFADQEAMAKGLRRIVRTRLAHGYVISSVDV